MNSNIELNLNDSKQRKKFPKESLNAIKNINNTLEKKETEIRCETEKQMKFCLDDIQNEFNTKIKSEMDLFVLRNKEIENRMQTQELLEKDKLRDNLVQRINNIIFDLKNREKDAELKVMNKQKQELIEANEKHKKDIMKVVEQMNKLVFYLEEKVDATDGNNGDMKPKSKLNTGITGIMSKVSPKPSTHTHTDSAKTAQQPYQPKHIPNKESEKKHSDKEREKEKEKEKDRQTKHKEKARHADADKHKHKKDDNHKNDKKDDKHKPHSNKPWDNLNRFNQ